VSERQERSFPNSGLALLRFPEDVECRERSLQKDTSNLVHFPCPRGVLNLHSWDDPYQELDTRPRHPFAVFGRLAETLSLACTLDRIRGLLVYH